MKKNIIIIFLLFTMLPAFASDWVQISEKDYMDLSSINEYNTIGLYADDVLYSVWIKNLNDKSEFWTNLEKMLNKKLWYSMSQHVVNCSRREIATKHSALYDTKNNSIYDKELYLEWGSVVPDTNGEYLYSLVCSANQASNPSNEIYDTNSNIKIKVKHRRK